MQVGIIGISEKTAKEFAESVLETNNLELSGFYDCNCSGMIGKDIYGKKVDGDILELFAAADVVVDFSNHRDKSRELILASEMETKYIIVGEYEKDKLVHIVEDKGFVKFFNNVDEIIELLKQ